MGQLAEDMKIDYILYGQNADDVGDFRRGATAAKEHGVRTLAKRWGLSMWDRPAMACLSSRFPYGTAVTAKGLKQYRPSRELPARRMPFRASAASAPAA